MSTVSVTNITQNSGVVERLLDAIISTGAYLNAKKWKEAALTIYSSMPHPMDFYKSDEDNALRRLKEKYSDEQKRICQTMGWRDYNQGNLSAFDGDLGPVEGKMRQIKLFKNKMKKGREREGQSSTKKTWRYRSFFFGRAQRGLFETEEGDIGSIIFHLIRIKVFSCLVCPDSQEEEVCVCIMRM